MTEEIKKQAETIIREFFEKFPMNKGEIFVVGCSTSEVAGERIGTAGSREIARAIFEVIHRENNGRGVYTAFQCCEHLNRALVIEGEAVLKYNYEPVYAVPKMRAGGSMAAYAYETLRSPVVVERIRAHAGIDIGNTLIGMHLREVAVPVRVGINKIGEANIVLAGTRPKYIGGPRTEYN